MLPPVLPPYILADIPTVHFSKMAYREAVGIPFDGSRRFGVMTIPPVSALSSKSTLEIFYQPFIPLMCPGRFCAKIP